MWRAMTRWQGRGNLTQGSVLLTEKCHKSDSTSACECACDSRKRISNHLHWISFSGLVLFYLPFSNWWLATRFKNMTRPRLTLSCIILQCLGAEETRFWERNVFTCLSDGKVKMFNFVFNDVLYVLCYYWCVSAPKQTSVCLIHHLWDLTF